MAILKKILKNNDFDKIYWHDSLLYKIEFDIVNDDVLFYIDLQSSEPDQENASEDNMWLIPAILRFAGITDMKINIEWSDSFNVPNISYIEREKIEISNKITDNVFYKYQIEFTTPTEGNIILPKVTEFELCLLGDPILFENEESYVTKRNEVLKNI
jgi:hypothetical protein